MKSMTSICCWSGLSVQSRLLIRTIVFWMVTSTCPAPPSLNDILEPDAQDGVKQQID